MSMNFERKLPIPMVVKKRFPLDENSVRVKAERDEQIKAVFEGRSDKFLLIIGPCSAEAKEPVLAYTEKLKTVQEKVADRIIIIPRIYTNKPRTNCRGYFGMLFQPDPNGKTDMYEGITAIRDIHICALRDYGFTCADELLYPDNYRYMSDLLGYVAVGARSVENQQHRLTASGLEVPVGMKNPTGGDLNVMMNSIKAGQEGHEFIYRGWQVESTGNPLTHAVLRGYTDLSGRNISNYHYEDLVNLCEMYDKSGLVNPAAIIDTNHANSGKHYMEQIRIAKDVLYSRNHNGDIKKLVKGLMIESYLEDGAADADSHSFGQSITDPCLGWNKTEELIFTLAEDL